MKKKLFIFGIVFCFVFSLFGTNISMAAFTGGSNKGVNYLMVNGGGKWPGTKKPSSGSSSSNKKPSSSSNKKPSSSSNKKPSSSPDSGGSSYTPPPAPTYKTIYTNSRANEFTATVVPDKIFYKVGDTVKLNGERDIEQITASQVLSSASGSTTKQTTGTQGSYSQTRDTYRYHVDITFEGFRVEYNGNVLPKNVTESNDTYNVFLDSLLNTDKWESETFKIVELQPTEYLDYDAEKGVATGKITAHSGYGTSKTFIIPFQFAPIGYSVDVFSDNPYLGTVSDSLIGKFKGQEATVTATEKVEGAFQYWYEKLADGTTKIVSYDKNYTFVMPERNMVLVAHFNYDVVTYKLYVTSNNLDWGETWTYDNNNDKTTYVENAVPGKQYELRYQVEPGYKFVRWEYRPYYDNEVENKGKIKMPAHDITVTAILEKDNANGDGSGTGSNEKN